MRGLFKRLFGSDDSPSEEQLTVLLESLNATDAYERVMAAEQLGQAKERRAVDGLIDALQSQMVAQFIERMQARAEQTSYEAMALYNEVARAEADLKQAAAIALGLIGEAHPDLSERIVPALRGVLHDRSYYVVTAARHALEQIDTPQARAALERS